MRKITFYLTTLLKQHHTNSTHRRSPSPVRVRRHRRSYTISAPVGTRVNAFPSPLGLPPTPPRKNSPVPSACSNKENNTPQPQPQPPPRCTSSSSAPILGSTSRRPNGNEAEPSSASPRRPRCFHTTSIHNDRFLDLPPLPDAWNVQHDKAICLLDSRNYSHATIVAKLRRVFPELHGTLTPLMIDKRLRILDQNVELDYWSIPNYRAQSTTPRAEPSVREQTVDITPTKSTKGSRFLDVMLGKKPKQEPKQEPRTAVKGLGMGVRSVFDRV